MKFSSIIQELSELPDPNVQAFLNDVKKIKRLSRQERQDYLTRLKEPGVMDLLVKDSIPAVIRASYSYHKRMDSLSVLDLINEGIFGVHKAFERCRKSGYKITMGSLYRYAYNEVSKVICKGKCPFALCSFDEESPELYKGRCNPNFDTSPLGKTKVIGPQMVKNDYGIKVKECCASCAYKELTRTSNRHCAKRDRLVKSSDVCEEWKMSETFQTIKI